MRKQCTDDGCAAALQEDTWVLMLYLANLSQPHTLAATVMPLTDPP